MGRRWSVNLGHPAAEAFQLMGERERGGIGIKAQFDHNSLAMSATATERRREKEENPHHRVKGGSKQAVCCYTQHAASFLEPPLNLLHTFLWTWTHKIRNGRNVDAKQERKFVCLLSNCVCDDVESGACPEVLEGSGEILLWRVRPWWTRGWPSSDPFILNE